MEKNRHVSKPRIKFFGLLLPLLLLVLIACTPAEMELIRGILQDVDTANGEITIVTEDGKTITLTISTDVSVETEGASSAIEALEPGTSIEVKVDDDGHLVHHIKAHQAKVEGVIVAIKENKITIESERGHQLTVHITSQTRIELEDDFPGTLADLQIGAEVEIKFDPDTLVAFKVATEEEEAEIEGFVVQVVDSEITVETERGRRLTLMIGNRTRIELEDDFPGTTADLQVNTRVEVTFDPNTRSAFKIEVEDEEAEVNGAIVKVARNEVTIETERGRILTLAIGEHTKIELGDDFPGSLADLQVGEEITARFNPATLRVFSIEVD